MKTLFASLVLLSAFAAKADGGSFNCAQHQDFSPVDPKVGAYIMTIKTGKEVRAPENSYVDYFLPAEVKLSLKKNGKTTVLKKFKGTAATADVSWSLYSRTQGLRIHIYLDELDQAGITLYANGKKTNISMDCSLE